MLHGWDVCDLKTGDFCYLDVITFSKQCQVLRTIKNPSHGSGWNRSDLQTCNFKCAPNVTSRMVHVSPGALVLVLKGDVWEITCDFNLVLC